MTPNTIADQPFHRAAAWRGYQLIPRFQRPVSLAGVLVQREAGCGSCLPVLEGL